QHRRTHPADVREEPGEVVLVALLDPIADRCVRHDLFFPSVIDLDQIPRTVGSNGPKSSHRVVLTFHPELVNPQRTYGSTGRGHLRGDDALAPENAGPGVDGRPPRVRHGTPSASAGSRNTHATAHRVRHRRIPGHAGTKGWRSLASPPPPDPLIAPVLSRPSSPSADRSK